MSVSLIGDIIGIIFLLIIVIILLTLSLRVIAEWQKAVVLRLGRVLGVKGPGLIFLIPFVDKPMVIDLRIVNVDVPPQTIVTKDNVTVTIDAVVYYKVIDPLKAVVSVSNYQTAVLNISQTSLRDIIGQMELDEILSKREEINKKLQAILDEVTEGWGIKVTNVTVRDIRLSQELLSAMAEQAKAERLRRAKIILSEGERQAASILSEASTFYQNNPVALQLRFLEMLSDISQRGNMVIVVPAGQELYSALSVLKAKPNT
ncbi:slipin family protein [Stygiolobus azoricus]|uniref:Slipin family protein n=1 Tax=Stygiolobus azoricus TaxID=41675 RepID=A0A650CQM8_9CREN|nr:slipin family protein [Stygiolobus azoricus]QGR20098.1 slipin family protein [Stygiolobus azoricus]